MALEQNSNLHTLHLSCNKIDDAGCQRLAQAFRKNSTVHTVNLLDFRERLASFRRFFSAFWLSSFLVHVAVVPGQEQRPRRIWY
jgi:hypothetical protein